MFLVHIRSSEFAGSTSSCSKDKLKNTTSTAYPIAKFFNWKVAFNACRNRQPIALQYHTTFYLMFMKGCRSCALLNSIIWPAPESLDNGCQGVRFRVVLEGPSSMARAPTWTYYADRTRCPGCWRLLLFQQYLSITIYSKKAAFAYNLIGSPTIVRPT